MLETDKIKNQLEKTLDEKITHVKILSDDIAKPAYLVQTSKIKFKLKLFDSLPGSVDKNFETLKHLQKYSFRSPKVLLDKRIKVENYSGAILEFIEGSPFISQSKLYKSAGEYLSELHKIPVKSLKHISKKNSVSQRVRIENYLRNTRIPRLNTSNKNYGLTMLEIVKTLPSFKEVPTVIINGDLQKDNLICNENHEVVSIDWDFAGLGTAARDIADFLINNTASLIDENHLVKAFFEGYLQKRNLTPTERNYILPELKLYLIEYGMEKDKDTINLTDFKRLLRIDSEHEYVKEVLI